MMTPDEIVGVVVNAARYLGLDNADILRLSNVVQAAVTGDPPLQSHHTIEHDGFAGTVIGHYTTREGKRGVVLQQDGTRVVHVYGEKWLKGPTS